MDEQEIEKSTTEVLKEYQYSRWPRRAIVRLGLIGVAGLGLGAIVYLAEKKGAISASTQTRATAMPRLPKVIATIPFGDNRSGAIVSNPTTHRVYAAQEDTPQVNVIDGRTNTIIATTPTKGYQTGIAVHPHTNLIYVSQEFAKSVVVIDGATNRVITELPTHVSVAGPLAINPTTNRLYVLGLDTHNVAVFDTATNTLLTIVPVNLKPNHIALNPNTNRIYIVHPSDSLMTVIDGESHTIITTLTLGGHPHRVVVNAVTNRIYVSNSEDNTLSVIEGITNRVSATIQTETPSEMALLPGANRLYVSNGATKVTLINCDTNAVVDTLPGLSLPGAMALLSPAARTNRLYIATDKSVTVVEDQSS